MRLGIIGYGAIAAVHASVLRSMPGVEVRAWGPDQARTMAFAREHDVVPSRRLRDHLDGLDGVVIASPSGLHQRQATTAIRAGVATLVELPACPSAAAGMRLERLASDRGVALESTHTSRYLEPFQVVGEVIAQGGVGDVRRVAYRRNLEPRARTWVDDALRHHGQHAIDLFMAWFGDLRPVACHLTPQTGPVNGARARMVLPHGAEVVIDIRYRGGPPSTTLWIEGTTGWLETDGFTTLRRSHGPELRWRRDATYGEAIRRQDDAFAAACAAAPRVGDGWREMIEATSVIDRLAVMATRGDA